MWCSLVDCEESSEVDRSARTVTGSANVPVTHLRRLSFTGCNVDRTIGDMQVSEMENLLVNLRTAIRQQELSQSAVAEAVGISRPHLNKLLQGHHVPTFSMCEKLCNYLGYRVAQMIVSPERFEKLSTAVA